MNRAQKAALLTRLVDKLREQESWAGETHLQKAVFFLQEMLGSPFGFEFIFYKHGPFSFDLRDELTGLRASGILDLEPQAPPYGPRFASTAVGQAIAERQPKTLGEQEARLDFVAKLFQDKGVKELERLATALYSSSELGWSVPVETRARFLNEIKPHVSLEEARQAVRSLDAIRDDVHRRGLDPVHA
jgi:uncharacterized protein YwgA